jgi:Ca-activated chloride channel homolog
LAVARAKASRRRRRRIKTRSLVLLAVVACLAVLIGRGSAQIISQDSCTKHPVNINVAVSSDIGPAIQRIAEVFNRQQHQVDGKCIAARISQGPPAEAAAQIDGQLPSSKTRIDAWIPDSSLWVDEARGLPEGATNVQPAGFSVARSPLMIVMPNAAAAAKVPEFRKAGWKLLLPTSAGGPPAPKGLRVDLPDPTQSAAGLATLIEIGRLLGSGASARVRFTRFAYQSEVTPYFDDPVSLTSFVQLAAPPLDGLPVTVTSEQAVVTYDDANPHQPLAAVYPTGSSAELGSPELDYPYVLTTSNRLRYAAAKAFGRMLTTPYAEGVIRYAGFRVGQGAGTPDQFPRSFGLGQQLLQVAPPAPPTAAPSELQDWNTLALPSRNLALVDVSAAMNVPANPADPSGPTLENEMSQTAALGLALFAGSSNLGLWEFADKLDGNLPYKPLVPVGPLTGDVGRFSRRALLDNIARELHADGGSDVALYGSILAAYKYMQRTYSAKFINTVVVLTSGVENAPGDITAQDLIKKLTESARPGRRVTVIIIIFGKSAVYRQLQGIAHATGGQAYQITNAQDIGKVFFRAIAHRLCSANCVAG